jgi:hypothetical protein
MAHFVGEQNRRQREDVVFLPVNIHARTPFFAETIGKSPTEIIGKIYTRFKGEIQ